MLSHHFCIDIVLARGPGGVNKKDGNEILLQQWKTVAKMYKFMQTITDIGPDISLSHAQPRNGCLEDLPVHDVQQPSTKQRE